MCVCVCVFVYACMRCVRACMCMCVFYLKIIIDNIGLYKYILKGVERFPDATVFNEFSGRFAKASSGLLARSYNHQSILKVASLVGTMPQKAALYEFLYVLVSTSTMIKFYI